MLGVRSGLWLDAGFGALGALVVCVLPLGLALSVLAAVSAWCSWEEERFVAEQRARVRADFERWAAATGRVLRHWGDAVVALGRRSSASLVPVGNGLSRVRVVAMGSAHRRDFVLCGALTGAAPLDDAADRVEWLAELDRRTHPWTSSPYR